MAIILRSRVNFLNTNNAMENNAMERIGFDLESDHAERLDHIRRVRQSAGAPWVPTMIIGDCPNTLPVAGGCATVAQTVKRADDVRLTRADYISCHRALLRSHHVTDAQYSELIYTL